MLPAIDEMERAYKRSDPTYDGIFFLGVKTTGVFCRPSCGARKPLATNVDYYSTAHEAVFAGYRPCKRCHPLEALGKPPAWAATLLREIEQSPNARISDARIKSLGIDPARARRFFKRQYGMTFQAYARGRRLGKALDQIRRGVDLDDVALGHGYESHSGFRNAFGKTFGSPPGMSRNAECIVVTWIESPLGPLIAGANAEGIVLLEFTDRRMLDAQFKALRQYFRCAIIPGENVHTIKLKEQLTLYFSRKLKRFTVPLICPGSEFQRKVWNELRRIPPGRTISYEELAARIGAARAQRAVGRTNGLNRIAIVIPCHRVVNKNGQLGGYGGGLWRKQKLLELEMKK